MDQIVFGSEKAKAIRDRDISLDQLVPCPTCYDEDWTNTCPDCKGAGRVKGHQAIEILRRPGFTAAKRRYLNTISSTISSAAVAEVLRILLLEGGPL